MSRLKPDVVGIVTGKEGIPLMIRDAEPFFTEQWSDVENR
jgi:hypothetical protein